MNNYLILALLVNLISINTHANLIELPPSPTPDTTLSLQAKTKGLMADNLTGAFYAITAAATRGFGLVWHNPFGLTPTQVFAGLGADACQPHLGLLHAKSTVGAALAGLVEPCHVACNHDGTVTLSACPTPSPTPSATP